MNIELTENEKIVLTRLAEDYDGTGWHETGFFSFKALTHSTGLKLEDVRDACRSLAGNGYARFLNGLVGEDGMMAGSGYGCTEKGAARISPCDVCGALCSYDYYVNEKGEQDLIIRGSRHVLECEKHYKQSPNQLPM